MDEKIAKILVIEDEEDVRESYLDMFEFFGYEVDSAPNGREGVVKVTNNDYEIVITDLNMPEMDGIEVLKMVKKNKPYIEVIVITGYATLENAIKAMKIGAYDYFTKPIDLELVKIVLSKCIQSIKARKENEELKTLNQKLTELNELKDKFITVTNHELRTPLTVLKGYLDLIDMFLPEDSDKDLIEALNISKETMKEMVTIIEHLHDLSFFDYGKKNYTKNEFVLTELLQTIYNEMKVLFKNRQIKFNFTLEGDPVKVVGDQERLKRSLRELLQNALKFTNENGEVNLIYAANNRGKNVFVKVIDSGIGIPVDKQDMIFEPFYEVQNSIHHTTSKVDFMGGGIGLGLTLAKQVIESHDGQIVVESELNKGSIFTVVLPFKNSIKN
ncbi:MAG: response regulator [Calditrichia bacterium]|nr:response regulator [Calditrichia bacterium]